MVFTKERSLRLLGREDSVISSGMAEQRAQWRSEVSVVVVIDDTSRRDRAVEVPEEAGCKVQASERLQEALGLLSENPSELVILDADCCGERYAELVKQINSSSPNSTVAFLVGWWDDRVPSLAGISRHFLYRSFRMRQVQEFLMVAVCEPRAALDSA